MVEALLKRRPSHAALCFAGVPWKRIDFSLIPCEDLRLFHFTSVHRHFFQVCFMSIAVRCRQCEKKLKVPEKLAGKKVRCPGCQSAVAVPRPKPKPADEEDDFLNALGAAGDGEQIDDDPFADAEPVAKPRKKKISRSKSSAKKSKQSSGEGSRRAFLGAAGGGMVAVLWLLFKGFSTFNRIQRRNGGNNTSSKPTGQPQGQVYQTQNGRVSFRTPLKQVNEQAVMQKMDNQTKQELKQTHSNQILVFADNDRLLTVHNRPLLAEEIQIIGDDVLPILQEVQDNVLSANQRKGATVSNVVRIPIKLAKQQALEMTSTLSQPGKGTIKQTSICFLHANYLYEFAYMTVRGSENDHKLGVAAVKSGIRIG